MISDSTANIVKKVAPKVGAGAAADNAHAARDEAAMSKSKSAEAPTKSGPKGGTKPSQHTTPIADATNAVLGAIGQGFAKALEVEKLISMPLAMIPCPGQPATRSADLVIGLPHGHMHPPNLVPPAPMIFLPSIGMIMNIPWLSTAPSVKINGSNAARCGDMAASIWCGGYFPLTEIFTGSASVWLEGGRAARAGDVTNHCIFTVPKPSDLPCGPFVGGVAGGAGDVKIGGFPMPSLTAAAVAAAMKIAGKAMKAGSKGAASLFRKGVNELEGWAAKRGHVAQIMKRSGLAPSEAGRRIRVALEQMAEHKSGRAQLERVANQAHDVKFAPAGGRGARVGPDNWADALVRREPDPNGAFVDTSPAHRPGAFNLGENGPGSGSTVYFDPTGNPNLDSETLSHELVHAANFGDGSSKVGTTSPDPFWSGKWKDYDEFEAVTAENAQHTANGTPSREGYIPKGERWTDRKTVPGEPAPEAFDDADFGARDTDPSADPFGDTLPPDS